MDRKDSIIKSLSQDLSEAEEQYQLALRFVENVGEEFVASRLLLVHLVSLAFQ